MTIQQTLLSGVTASALTAHLQTKPATWRKVLEVTSDGISSDWRKYVMRMAIVKSVFGGKFSKIRLTLKAAPTGLDIGSCYIGHQLGAGTLDNISFAETQPIPVTFDGGKTASIAANASKTSDPIDFSYDGERSVVVSFYVTGANDLVGTTEDDPRFIGAYYGPGDDVAGLQGADFFNYSGGSGWYTVREIEVLR